MDHRLLRIYLFAVVTAALVAGCTPLPVAPVTMPEMTLVPSHTPTTMEPTATTLPVIPTDTAQPPTPAPPLPEAGIAWMDISAGGRWIAFATYPDAAGSQGVFLHDRETGQTRYIAAGSMPSLSADGRYLAYGLPPTFPFVEEGKPSAIYVYGQETGEHELVSVSSSGGPANGVSGHPVISADGRYVAFESSATNLVDEPSASIWFDVYLHDRETGATERIQYAGYGAEAYASSGPGVSADGRYAVFVSGLVEPPPGDERPEGMFVYDRQTGEAQAVGSGFFPVLSADGSMLVYLSRGDAPPYAEGWINAFAYHLVTGERRWLGRVLDFPPDGWWQEQVITVSADGAKIAFRSVLDNPRDPAIPSPEPAGGLGSVYLTIRAFVYDWAADTLERVDAPASPDVNSSMPHISGDGRFVAYLSGGVGDPVSAYRLFVRDLETGVSEAVDLSAPVWP